MIVEIKVPVLPESVSEGTLGAWHKKVGDPVQQDELLVELETDKVVLEIVATESGVLKSIDVEEGATVVSNQVIGSIDTEAATQAGADTTKTSEESPAAQAAPVAEQPAAAPTEAPASTGSEDGEGAGAKAGPAARKLMKQHGIDASEVQGSGSRGSITRQDVEKHIRIAAEARPSETPVSTPAAAPSAPVAQARLEGGENGRSDRRVPMSRLRQRIAERLKQAQNTAAMLTTFNEVDLKPMMDLRARYKESFEKTHGVKLGMMSFFTKAAVEALRRFPAVNASIDGNDIVYHDYFDIGIAVSSDRGLVVPILRDADQMSYADVEQTIRDLATRARDGKLTLDELTGGTFSITNGGVFGSMLSTPILNPPQSAILGMHTIQQRPVAVDGEVVIRPMMYLALTYDHRIIDGREAVQFLVTIKQLLEDPARQLLEL
ncbi:MAG TPA: 2-oxoglutarate dehydrogenase complex dihydrolipoyllysine-residue succinyltransferase [Rhodospirillales bacterium]|nr:2-oxoglutarate dehydrogenase complex dihydrolipoyllysine-residue succinyltransferase [Rhodospirillales bacterium]